MVEQCITIDVKFQIQVDVDFYKGATILYCTISLMVNPINTQQSNYSCQNIPSIQSYLVDEVQNLGQDMATFSNLYWSFIESPCLRETKCNNLLTV